MANAELITMTASPSWIKSGNVLCFKIAGRYFFQFSEIEFAKASTVGFKQDTLWTLGKSVGNNYERAFMLYSMNDNRNVRLLCANNKIYGHYSDTYTDMHYYGLLVM